MFEVAMGTKKICLNTKLKLEEFFLYLFYFILQNDGNSSKIVFVGGVRIKLLSVFFNCVFVQNQNSMISVISQC